MAIINANKLVDSVFKMVRFGEILPIVTSEEEALARLRQEQKEEAAPSSQPGETEG